MTDLKLDLRGADPALQREYWQGVAPTAYAVRNLGNRLVPLDVRLSIWRHGGIAASRFSSRSYVVARPDENVARHAARFVKIKLFLRGGAVLFEGGRSHQLDGGAVYMIDQSRSWNIAYGDHEQLSVFVPHGLIGYDPYRFPVCTRFSTGGGVGRFLHAGLTAFLQQVHGTEGSDAETLEASFVGMIRGALEGATMTARSEEIRGTRLKAMCAFIEARLADPDLSPETLEREFGVSRATLFRDFHHLGGVMNHIRTRRLQHAFNELAGSNGRRGIVALTADRWHFGSASQFSDAFLRQFGARPGEIVGMQGPLRDAGVGAQPATVRPDDAPAGLESTQTRLKRLYESFTE